MMNVSVDSQRFLKRKNKNMKLKMIMMAIMLLMVGNIKAEMYMWNSITSEAGTVYWYDTYYEKRGQYGMYKELYSWEKVKIDNVEKTFTIYFKDGDTKVIQLGNDNNTTTWLFKYPNNGETGIKTRFSGARDGNVEYRIIVELIPFWPDRGMWKTSITVERGWKQNPHRYPEVYYSEMFILGGMVIDGSISDKVIPSSK